MWTGFILIVFIFWLREEAKTAVKHCVEKLPAMNAQKQAYLEAVALTILIEGQKRNQVLRHLHKAFDKFLPGAIPDVHTKHVRRSSVFLIGFEC